MRKAKLIQVESKQPVTVKAIDEKGNQVNVPATGKDLKSADVTDEIKQAAELGVGCPGNCGASTILKLIGNKALSCQNGICH